MGLDQAKQHTALRRVFVKGKIEVTVYIAKALESIRTGGKGWVSLQVKYLFHTLNTCQNLDVAASGLGLVLDTSRLAGYRAYKRGFHLRLWKVLEQSVTAGQQPNRSNRYEH
jgi:hypothetical protein